jgi:GNAT superfamily N-acetyltransferase
MTERDVFVCHKGGRIVGTIALGADRLRSLFVDPELQRAGIGARLVSHLETHARKVGVSELKLSSSLTARGFYERLGYRLISLRSTMACRPSSWSRRFPRRPRGRDARDR